MTSHVPPDTHVILFAEPGNDAGSAGAGRCGGGGGLLGRHRATRWHGSTPETIAATTAANRRIAEALLTLLAAPPSTPSPATPSVYAPNAKALLCIIARLLLDGDLPRLRFTADHHLHLPASRSSSSAGASLSLGSVADPVLLAWLHDPDAPPTDLERLAGQTAAVSTASGSNGDVVAWDALLPSFSLAAPAILTPELRRFLHELSAAPQLWHTLASPCPPSLLACYWRQELPFTLALARMELAGAPFDCAVLARHRAAVVQRVLALEREAHAAAGVSFLVSSPEQVAEVLFDRLRLPRLEHSAAGQAQARTRNRKGDARHPTTCG